MTEPDPDLANTAARLYQRQADRADRLVATGRMHHAEAARRLRPWLAMALLLGAEIPQVADALAEQRTRYIHPRDGEGIAEARLREDAARDICAPSEMRAELRKALIASADSLLADRADVRPAASMPPVGDDPRRDHFQSIHAICTALAIRADFPLQQDFAE